MKEIRGMKKGEIIITFHNPNSEEELADKLIKLAAEVANEKLKKELLRAGKEQTQ